MIERKPMPSRKQRLERDSLVASARFIIAVLLMVGAVLLLAIALQDENAGLLATCALAAVLMLFATIQQWTAVRHACRRLNDHNEFLKNTTDNRL